MLTKLLLFVGLAASTKPAPFIPNFDDIDGNFVYGRLQTSEKQGPPTRLVVTEHVVELKRATSWSLSSVYVQALRRQASAKMGEPERATNGSAQLMAIEAGSVFLAPITAGGQDFFAVVDTGSSDTWLVSGDFTCVSPSDGTVQSQSDCYFGPAYDPTISSNYTMIQNQNFNITYADGESLTGDMAFDTYTLGGITVPNQEFGLVDYAAWYGDQYSSGLVGLCYSTLTSAYAGTDPHQDTYPISYPTIFDNMYNNQSVPPVFSLAITRDPSDSGNGGVLALGGIPNVPHSPYFASAPIIPYGINRTSGALVYQYYTVDTEGFAISKSQGTQFNLYSTPNSKKTPLVGNGTNVIIDSGTTLVYLPNDVATAITAAFTPPGAFDPDTSLTYVSCTAIPPVVGVSIGRKIFYINPVDMIAQVNNTACISGVQPSMSGLSLLGDVWMKSVIAVFDIGAQQMRFAAREFY